MNCEYSAWNYPNVSTLELRETKTLFYINLLRQFSASIDINSK